MRRYDISTRSRRLIGAALAVGVCTSGASPALARPVMCNLVVDARGDTEVWPSGPAQNEPAYDLVSAGLGSDDDRLTAVIRVAKLSKTVATSPFGARYLLTFHDASTGLKGMIGAYTYPPTESEYFWANYSRGRDKRGARVSGDFDETTNAITISVPLSLFGRHLRRGSRLSSVEVWVQRDLVLLPGIPADSATGGRVFTLGSRSCAQWT